jgi:hypothetical protein
MVLLVILTKNQSMMNMEVGYNEYDWEWRNKNGHLLRDSW